MEYGFDEALRKLANGYLVAALNFKSSLFRCVGNLIQQLDHDGIVRGECTAEELRKELGDAKFITVAILRGQRVTFRGWKETPLTVLASHENCVWCISDEGKYDTYRAGELEFVVPNPKTELRGSMVLTYGGRDE